MLPMPPPTAQQQADQLHAIRCTKAEADAAAYNAEQKAKAAKKVKAALDRAAAEAKA